MSSGNFTKGRKYTRGIARKVRGLKVCSTTGCGMPIARRGLCENHARQKDRLNRV